MNLNRFTNLVAVVQLQQHSKALYFISITIIIIFNSIDVVYATNHHPTIALVTIHKAYRKLQHFISNENVTQQACKSIQATNKYVINKYHYC